METLTIQIPDEKSSMIKQVLKELGVEVIETHSEVKSLNLSPEQEKEIISSQKQIKKGLYVEHSTLGDEINKWLKK